MRHGSALPVVLVVLLIAATLGSTFLFTSRGGYRATAQAAYRLRLQTFMVSALDEARTRLFQLTTPGVGGLTVEDPGLRNRILDAIPVPELPIEPGTTEYWEKPEEYGLDVSQVDFEVPLDLYKGRDILWASRAIAFADVPRGAQEVGRVEIIEAKARIHGLRYLPYEDTGTFPGPMDYYQSQVPFKDPSLWHRDYMGYCTITIHAKLKSKMLELQRKMSVTHDIKVVDVRPPARDFLLFSYRSPIDDTDRIYKALNEGGRDGSGRSQYNHSNPPSGRLILYPMSLGRVYIRGPYIALAEGHTDGLGGRNPQPGPSYPQGRYGNWGGWGQIPGPRGIIMPAKKELNWQDAPSPLRPTKACTRTDSDGSSSLGVPVFNSAIDFLKSGDAVGFGMSGLFTATSFGPNRQRFYLTGEPQCYGQDDKTCFNDGFRGVLIKNYEHLDEKEVEEGTADFLQVWAPQAEQDGTWRMTPSVVEDKTYEVKDGDRLVTESGPAALGLYTVAKFYPFITGENCPRPGWFDSWSAFGDNLGRTASGVGDFIGEVGTLGGFQSEGYTRRWKGEDRDAGLKWDDPIGDLSELAEKKMGNPLPEMKDDEDFETYLKRIEPDLAIIPFGIYYAEPKNQGWLNTFVNLGLDLALTALMFIPGPGTVAGLALTGARFAARGAVQAGATKALGLWAKQSFGRRLAMDVAAAYTVDRAVLQAGMDHLRPDSTQPDVDHPSTVGGDANPGEAQTEQQMANELKQVRAENATADAQSVLQDIEALEGEVTDEQRRIAEELREKMGTFKGIVDAYQEMGRKWEAAMPYLNTMMTGLPPPDGKSPSELADAWKELRRYENFGQDVLDIEQQQYVGFLPPGIKPYQRMATRWHRSVNELVGPEGNMFVDGVIAVDRFPQQSENFNTDITYSGRGVLVSGSNDDADKPALLGNIIPADKNNDHMTLSYWNHIPPDQAKDKEGTGMLGLGGEVWASIVSPYGVHPKTRNTVVRGNMITQYLDRNRYPDSANLKLVYRWETLRPDLGSDGAGSRARTPGEKKGIFSEAAVRSWQRVIVSPKVCGWYDSVQ